MKRIKAKNGYYVDNFSSVSEESSWLALTNFIKENMSNFSSVSFKPDEKRVIVSFTNDDKFLSIIKSFNSPELIQKTLIRTIKLNVEFEKETGNFILSDKNVENFKDYNQIFYNITFEDVDDDILYFHESTLNNDDNDSNVILVLLNFNEIQGNTILNKSIFLCYDSELNKFIEDQYLNKDNSSFDVNMFIKLYNEDKLNDLTIFENFTNFKISKSNFILLNKTINDFINFKTIINSFIYESFINSLYESLEIYKGGNL